MKSCSKSIFHTKAKEAKLFCQGKEKFSTSALDPTQISKFSLENIKNKQKNIKYNAKE